LAHNVTLAAAAACVMSLLLAASVHAKDPVPGMMMAPISDRRPVDLRQHRHPAPAKNWNSRCMYNCEVAEAPCFAKHYNKGSSVENSSNNLQNEERCEHERAACRQKCP
jgi:hypothetical protein